MSETRFTPGPWRLGENADHTTAIVAGGRVVAFPAVEHRMSMAQMEANAHLIASAPDLFATAEALLSDHEMECGSCPDCDTGRFARAALAKARGETLARGRWHVHSCRFCAHGRQVGVAFLLCPVGVKRYTKAWVAAGRRREAALVLREVSRGR